MQYGVKLFLQLLSMILLLGSNFSLAASERLSLSGSSTVAPLALEIAKRFEQQQKNIRIDVQTGGSSRGVLDARNGLVDIGMVSRALKPTEQDLTVTTIAYDGVGIILHRDNPLNELSHEQIIGIYTGTIRNWREVGGNDLPITVVNKSAGHSTLELFQNYFNLKNSQIKAHVIIGDNQQGIKTVAGNPGAIGYVSIGTAEYEEQNGVAIKRLPMDNIPATVSSVRAGLFPLSRPLNLVVKGTPSPLVQRFLDYARSAVVNDLIEAQFFVPLSE